MILDPETQRSIDTIIFEITLKLEAIVEEMKAIKFSDLDDVTKREKSDYLRKEFESVLNEQHKRVEQIMRGS